MKKIRRKSEKECTDLARRKSRFPILRFRLSMKLPGIVHGFSSRLGGVSEGCLSTMNLSFSRGDEPERGPGKFSPDRGEHRIFRGGSGLFHADPHRPTSAGWEEEDCGRGLQRPVGYRDVDGLVTNEPGGGTGDLLRGLRAALLSWIRYATASAFPIPAGAAPWARSEKSTVETMAREFGSEPGGSSGGGGTFHLSGVLRGQ